MKSFAFAAAIASASALIPVRFPPAEETNGIIDPEGLTTKQYNELLAGIVYGVIDKNDCTEMEACISEGKTDAI